jgi:hypothetical protein
VNLASGCIGRHHGVVQWKRGKVVCGKSDSSGLATRAVGECGAGLGEGVGEAGDSDSDKRAISFFFDLVEVRMTVMPFI